MSDMRIPQEEIDAQKEINDLIESLRKMNIPKEGSKTPAEFSDLWNSVITKSRLLNTPKVNLQLIKQEIIKAYTDNINIKTFINDHAKEKDFAFLHTVATTPPQASSTTAILSRTVGVGTSYDDNDPNRRHFLTSLRDIVGEKGSNKAKYWKSIGSGRLVDAINYVQETLNRTINDKEKCDHILSHFKSINLYTAGHLEAQDFGNNVKSVINSNFSSTSIENFSKKWTNKLTEYERQGEEIRSGLGIGGTQVEKQSEPPEKGGPKV